MKLTHIITQNLTYLATYTSENQLASRPGSFRPSLAACPAGAQIFIADSNIFEIVLNKVLNVDESVRTTNSDHTYQA